MGPMYQSQVEFTITTVVSWDLTSVEGVSGGLTMNYTNNNGQAEDVVAIPGKFKGETTCGWGILLEDVGGCTAAGLFVGLCISGLLPSLPKLCWHSPNREGTYIFFQLQGTD